MWDQVKYPEDWFSHKEAHIVMPRYVPHAPVPQTVYVYQFSHSYISKMGKELNTGTNYSCKIITQLEYSNFYTPSIRSIYRYRGYIVFAFSVRMLVCVCVCVSVNFFSVKDFSETT